MKNEINNIDLAEKLKQEIFNDHEIQALVPQVRYDTPVSGGCTIFNYALLNGKDKAIQLFLAHGAKPNHYEVRTALNLKDLTIAKMFLEKDTDPNATPAGDMPLLQDMIGEDNMGAVELLLKYKADPNVGVDGISLIRYAILNKKIAAAKLLIKAGADLQDIGLNGFLLGLEEAWNYNFGLAAKLFWEGAKNIVIKIGEEVGVDIQEPLDAVEMIPEAGMVIMDAESISIAWFVAGACAVSSCLHLAGDLGALSSDFM